MQAIQFFKELLAKINWFKDWRYEVNHQIDSESNTSLALFFWRGDVAYGILLSQGVNEEEGVVFFGLEDAWMHLVAEVASTIIFLCAKPEGHERIFLLQAFVISDKIALPVKSLPGMAIG